MAKSLTVQIEPNVLKWLRESAGWEIAKVSKKLKTTQEVIKEFETGRHTDRMLVIAVVLDRTPFQYA